MSILSSSFLETSLLPASVSSVDHQEAERDLFSSVSTFTKGEQMVPVLNQLGVHCAVYGNHDFGENMEYIFCVQLMFFFSRFWPGDPRGAGVQDHLPVADVQCGGQGDWRPARRRTPESRDRLGGEEGGHPRAG